MNLQEIINSVKQELERRAKMIGVYDKNTTITFDVQDKQYIYVVCNVLLPATHEEFGFVKRYNVTVDLRTNLLFPVLIPDLIARINLEDKEIIFGSGAFMERRIDRFSWETEEFKGLDILIRGLDENIR